MGPSGERESRLASRSSQRLRELDGWRAFSVLMVVVHHSCIYQHSDLVNRIAWLEHMIYYAGALGVKTFFVISGFVICRLLILEEQNTGAISLRGFYIRRIFRILPPFILYVAAITVLFSLGWIPEEWWSILGSALFLGDIHIVPPNWFLGHTWSLAVEEQFYLVFPALWIFTPSKWRGRLFLTVFFLCAIWNLSILWSGRDGMIGPGQRAGFVCVSCGVLAAIHEDWIRCVAARLPALIVALVALVLVIHPAAFHSRLEVIYDNLLMPPAIALVLMYSLDAGAWWKALLCNRLVQSVGLMSYGLYLWQQLFTAPYGDYFGRGTVIPYLLPLLIVIVPLSYYLVEKPAIRLGKTLSDRNSRDAIPVV